MGRINHRLNTPLKISKLEDSSEEIKQNEARKGKNIQRLAKRCERWSKLIP